MIGTESQQNLRSLAGMSSGPEETLVGRDEMVDTSVEAEKRGIVNFSGGRLLRRQSRPHGGDWLGVLDHD